MTIVFRRPNPGEETALAGLHVQCWQDAYAGIIDKNILANLELEPRIARWRARIENGEIVPCAFDDGIPIGFGHAGPADGSLIEIAPVQIRMLYVSKEYHRRGIGRVLFREMMVAYAETNVSRFVVCTLQANLVAKKFYESMGSRIIGSRPFKIGNQILTEDIYALEA